MGSRKSILIVLLGVICLSGCRPRGVLSSREMQRVLVDLHRADAVLQVGGYNYGHDEDLAKYYQEILNQHGITQAQFDSSIVWYTNNPQRFDKIYPRVIKDLEAERERWQALQTDIPPQNVQEIDVYLRPLEQLLWEMAHGLQVLYWTIGEEEMVWRNAGAIPIKGPINLMRDSI